MNSLRRCTHILSSMMMAALTAGALALAAATSASAQPASDAQIPWWVIGTGGVSGSSSGDVRMSATLGQPVIGMTSETGGAILYQGFWYPRQLASGVELGPNDAVAGLAGLRNYPNPFTGSTTIHYMLPGSGQVRLAIYDMRGDLVRTLVEGTQDGGPHDVLWDGLNDRGESTASASYLCLVEVDVAAGSTTRRFTERQIMQRLR